MYPKQNGKYNQDKWNFNEKDIWQANQPISALQCVCVNDDDDYTQTIIVAIFSLSFSILNVLPLSHYIAGLTVHAITNCNWLVKFGITCFNAIKIQMNRIQLNLKRPTNRYSVCDVVYGVSIFISSFPFAIQLYIFSANVIVVGLFLQCEFK